MPRCPSSVATVRPCRCIRAAVLDAWGTSAPLRSTACVLVFFDHRYCAARCIIGALKQRWKLQQRGRPSWIMKQTVSLSGMSRWEWVPPARMALTDQSRGEQATAGKSPTRFLGGQGFHPRHHPVAESCCSVLASGVRGLAVALTVQCICKHLIRCQRKARYEMVDRVLPELTALRAGVHGTLAMLLPSVSHLLAMLPPSGNRADS
jgi:hypothetical protein